MGVGKYLFFFAYICLSKQIYTSYLVTCYSKLLLILLFNLPGLTNL